MKAIIFTLGVVVGLGIACLVNLYNAFDDMKYYEAHDAVADCQLEYDGWRYGWSVYCKGE